MKRYLLLWWSVCSTIVLLAQDRSVQWIQGDAPMSIVSFRNDTITNHFVTNDAVMFIGSANICDEEGSFLFFSNGIYIRDIDGNLMPNGDSLCYDKVWYGASNSIYNTVYENGLPSDQSILVIPAPIEKKVYYVFHYLTADTSYLRQNRINNAPLVLYYTIVDMNENNGLGSVTVKNVRLPIYEPMSSSRMTAVKHGNGRDWWLIRHGDGNNKYIKFLVTKDSISGPFYQFVGPNFNHNNEVFDFYGTSVFNQEGSKFASANLLGPVVVLDFDRCSGEFSNPVTINNMLLDTNLPGAIGLSFSPSGRFLYVSDKLQLRQYDLESSNINDSIVLYTSDSSDFYLLHQHGLALNGKIYVSTWHGGLQGLHAIEKPNELGTASNFVYNAVQTISLNTNKVPNMVNYKLGAALGSGCDTVVSGINDLAVANLNLQLFPNPVQKNLTVRTKQYVHQARLRLLDAIGKVLYENPNFHQEETLDLDRLSQGIYFVEVSNKLTKCIGKFVKE